MKPADWAEVFLAIFLVTLYYAFILTLLAEPGSYKHRWEVLVDSIPFMRIIRRAPAIICGEWNKIVYQFKQLD